jgi:hypothetical protein
MKQRSTGTRIDCVHGVWQLIWKYAGLDLLPKSKAGHICGNILLHWGNIHSVQILCTIPLNPASYLPHSWQLPKTFSSLSLVIFLKTTTMERVSNDQRHYTKKCFRKGYIKDLAPVLKLCGAKYFKNRR